MSARQRAMGATLDGSRFYEYKKVMALEKPVSHENFSFPAIVYFGVSADFHQGFSCR
jgi:hypothetical protein